MNALPNDWELAAYEGFGQVTASWQSGFRTEEGLRTSVPTSYLNGGGVRPEE